MGISAATLKDFRAGARTQLARAGKKLASLQERVLRTGANWATESKARAAEWTGWFRRVAAKRPQRLDEWQMRVMDAVGIASAGRVRRMSRELSRLAKRVDSLASRKA
jgi:hypothetical protein